MRTSGDTKRLSDEVLQEVCREIGDLLPCDRICLALPSSDATRITLLTAHPRNERHSPRSLRRKGSRAAQVLKKGLVEYASNLRKTTRYPEDRILREQGIAEAAFVPLGPGEKAGCVLILGSNEPGGMEGKATGIPREALGRVAAAIGAAGTAAEEPGSVLRRVAEFSKVANRIVQEDDLDTVCRLFLEAVRGHSGYTRAVLTLLDDQGGDRQFFFTGFSDQQIDYYHARKPTKAQREAVIREGRRIGNSYLVAAAGCNDGGLRPGAAKDLLFIPLYGTGATLVGTVMLVEPPAAAQPTAESLSLIELFAGQMGHAVQKKGLDREIKAMEAKLLSVQSQLLQAEKMSAIGLLISGVTHELNNPLSGIMGFAQLLLASELNPKTRKHLERIHSEAVRSQKIVQNLLSFARRHKPQKTHEELNRVIDGVLDLRAYQLKVDNVEVVRRYDADLPKTMLDFHQLQQVILNVINNAHHAMMEVGDRPRRLVIATQRSGATLRASFTDSGTGIPKDRLESIFDPFFTTKKGGKGTGLGLSVSRAIIKDHQGALSAESVLGEGTTIHIDLPLIAAPSQDCQSEDQKKAKGGPARPLRLLVVDDEMILVELLTEFLKMNGHTVDAARHGQAALKLATANDYDVILSDLKMPGLDGQGFYDRLLKVKPRMARRFIFTTGDLANPKTQAFFHSTGCPYLCKPFRLEMVLTLLEQISRTLRAA
ncbi:MAG: ATP-binding protein [Acidobacteriota bacterium]